MITTKTINERNTLIHNNNLEAGWWTDLKTGQSIIETRNRPEIMLLIWSELSEASDGFFYTLMDDKLPERYMAEVELADAAIRLHDLLGAEKIEVLEYRPAWIKGPTTFEEHLAEVGHDLSHALEGYRKTNRADAHWERVKSGLRAATVKVYEIARIYNFDIDGAIEEKLAFNKNRSDHKIDNRLKDGGKKI